MIKYASRAYNILRTNGARKLAAHSLKFIAFKLDPYGLSLNEKNLPKTGQVEPNGAIIARPIPDDINPPVSIPLIQNEGSISFEKTAVIIHAFYPDILPEILRYLKNIPVPFGLFISTDTNVKRDHIIDIINAYDHDLLENEVIVTPNRGRDIGPKYIGFTHVYKKYECFLHLHTKKSLHADGLGEKWRSYLLRTLIGSKQIAKSNLILLSHERVGVVYPEHMDEIKEHINWGFNFPIAKNLLNHVGVSLDVNTILEFPSGSMFWGRSKAIDGILGLNLDYLDFPEEAGQIDGTLAHAIERCVLLFVESSGFEWARTTLTAPSKMPAPNKRFTPLLGSENSANTIIADRVPEAAPFMFSPEHCQRPRLNLVLPTVNPKEVFGGISTALKIFEDLKVAFKGKIDVRVIVTETHISAITDSLIDYHIQHIGAEEYAKEVLLGAKERHGKHLQLRPNDIFIGTVWWTALNCFRAHDAQKIFFGEAPKVIYLMQDFEPDFYGWSTRYSLAEATYLRGDDTIALINSEELMQHFATKYDHPHKLVIPYTINSKIDASLTHSVREKIILFYARPSTVRNCFEAGIDGLALWARRNPTQASQWKVYCIGEQFSSNLAHYLPNCIITGKMSLEEYASLLSRASVGLSLMVSPHPSYPPLEMAYSGVRTVTNRYPGKDLSSRSDYIKSIQIPTPDLIAPAIEEQVRIAEQEMIGKVTPIRNIIRDIPVDVNSYTAEETLRLLLGTS